MRAAVTWFDGVDWRDGVVAASATGPRLLPDAARTGLPQLDGVIIGAFTDHHVHLQLVDFATLADSAVGDATLANSTLGRVVDLGGDPDVLAEFTESRTASGIEVLFAGAFLTPPGGYPSDREWAPAGSVREIPDAAAAERAIGEMKDAGATRIKIASNNQAGPVFSDEMMRTVIRGAAARRLPVITHAEGPGEAQRAVRLGAARLAHAPFSERLSVSAIAEQVASAAWISTLAIHSGETYDIAVDNVRRFRAAGGTVIYGTDMGNGHTSFGLNSDELDALEDSGYRGVELLQCLDPTDPRDAASRLLFLPGCSPEAADPRLARPLTPADLES